MAPPIPLRKVVLTRHDGKVEEHTTVEAKTYASASEILAKMAETAPVSGFHMVGFQLHFADEYVYEGVVELTPLHRSGYDLAQHVTNFFRRTLTDIEGKDLSAAPPVVKRLVAKAKRISKGYDLTQLPHKDEVVIENLFDRIARDRAERFSGIQAPPAYSGPAPRVWDDSWMAPSTVPEKSVEEFHGEIDISGRTFSIKPPQGKQ